jgi:hypothetical protein
MAKFKLDHTVQKMSVGVEAPSTMSLEEVARLKKEIYPQMYEAMSAVRAGLKEKYPDLTVYTVV